MKLDYTVEELGTALQTLSGLFADVALLDPRTDHRVDPYTREPIGERCTMPVLDEVGRGAELRHAELGAELVLYQGIRVEGHSLILAMHGPLPHNLFNGTREKDSFHRAFSHYHDDLLHDCVTGAYNAHFVNKAGRLRAEQSAAAGGQVGVVLVRVNEYAAFCADNAAAGDRCLNMAAGILQLAIGVNEDKALLARLEDGLFAVVVLDAPLPALKTAVQEALHKARREFNLSLSRRAVFTTAVGAASWAEAGNWERMLSLAQRRLDNL